MSNQHIYDHNHQHHLSHIANDISLRNENISQHTMKVEEEQNPMRDVDDKKWNLATILLILLIILLLLPLPFIVNSSICVDRFSKFHMSCKMSHENIFKNKTTKRKFTTMKAWRCHLNKQIFLYLNNKKTKTEH